MYLWFFVIIAKLCRKKILAKLHKIQDAKAVKVLILDDTVEDKETRKIRGLNVLSLNYSDGFSKYWILLLL